jgi:hypothetical protein
MTRAWRLAIAALGGVIFALVLAAVLAAPVLAPSPSGAAAPAPTASAQSAAPVTTPTDAYPDVDGARALEHTTYLADPARGGRFTASAGYDDAARYVADRFAELGLEPWGDGGTFFSRFTMPLVDLAATPVLERLADGKRYRHRTDFTERVGGTFGSGDVEGTLAFVGAGSTTDLAKVDVRGKIAIVILAGRADPGRQLASGGAAAAIYISNTIIKFSYIPRFDPVTLPGIVVTQAAADELLQPSGRTVTELAVAVDAQARGAGPSPAFDLATRMRLAVPLTPLRDVEATNVIGLLRGSDTDAAKRAVVVGGHLDGVGTDPDGTVFEAANDNASGPALTIEVARALISRRAELRHSVVFVAFAGEEQGLRGSEAFVESFSALPGRRESLLGYVNLDVVGCCGSTVSASNENSSIVGRARTAAERLGVAFESEGSGSSDQASFTRRGIAATLLNWSSIGPIHTTEDTIGRISAESLETLGRVAALMTLEMAAAR